MASLVKRASEEDAMASLVERASEEDARTSRVGLLHRRERRSQDKASPEHRSIEGLSFLTRRNEIFLRWFAHLTTWCINLYTCTNPGHER